MARVATLEQIQRPGVATERLPLTSSAVAGFAVYTVTKSEVSKHAQPNLAFRHPSGWNQLDTRPSLLQELFQEWLQARDNNSIEGARNAQFSFTRKFLNHCLEGDIIDEGPAPNDTVFSLGSFVEKEDVRIFWIPSPVQSEASTLCLSVNRELGDDKKKMDFLDNAFVTWLGAYCIEKFKGGYISVHVWSADGLFRVEVRRDELLAVLERQKSLGKPSLAQMWIK